jgi:hypothetical protein
MTDFDSQLHPEDLEEIQEYEEEEILQIAPREEGIPDPGEDDWLEPDLYEPPVGEEKEWLREQDDWWA